MDIDALRDNIPNLPDEIFSQLERVNESPPIHRYVQLHNSFELIVRYLAISSFCWLKALGRSPALLASFGDDMKRPGLETWIRIFERCAKRLYESGDLKNSPRADIESEAVKRAIEYMEAFSHKSSGQTRPRSTRLLRALRIYRNLTRGHGTLVYRGYEEFLGDLEDSLKEFMFFWSQLLNVRTRLEKESVHMVFGGASVDATTFMKKREDGKVRFYNRAERADGRQDWYFLDYETGRHHPEPGQGAALDAEFRIAPHPQKDQLGLFPKSWDTALQDLELESTAELEAVLSFKKASTPDLHPGHQMELEFVAGLLRFLEGQPSTNGLAAILEELHMDGAADHGIENAYLDFTNGTWNSLVNREQAAVRRFKEETPVSDIAELLWDRLHEELDDEDLPVEELSARLATMIEALDSREASE